MPQLKLVQAVALTVRAAYPPGGAKPSPKPDLGDRSGPVRLTMLPIGCRAVDWHISWRSRTDDGPSTREQTSEPASTPLSVRRRRKRR